MSRIYYYDLENLQSKLMANYNSAELWMQESELQEEIQAHALEQAFYWAQRAKKDWSLLEIK